MYRGRLERDLTVWVDKGLVDANAAKAILQEYDGRPASFSLGRVLAVLAALLVSAAVLLLIASNWDAIPRIVRLCGIVAWIWALYLGAAAMMTRQASASAAALLVLATMSFGGAISLVGQMYHLSGDELTVMLVWFGVAVVAAVLFRSGALAVLAGFLSWAVFGTYLGLYGMNWIGVVPWITPLLAALIVALVRYTGAPRGRHLAYLLFIGWLTWLYTLHAEVSIAALFVAGGGIVFLLLTLPIPAIARFLQSAGPAPAFYAFLVCVIGITLLHADVVGGWGLIALSLGTLAVAIIAIMLCGRDNGAVRYLAYTVFALEVLYLSFVTVGTIIGTSGFFLSSGVLVAIAAWVVIRLERRFSAKTSEASL